MKCKLCGEEKVLVNAHIIPKVFYNYIYKNTNDHSLALASSKNNVRKKRVPKGIYDKKILCKECDNSLGVYDDYASRLLLCEFDPGNFIADGQGYKIDKYAFDKLSFFFLSVLWRASITTHELFRRVSLGPYETKIKDILTMENVDKLNEFNILILRYLDFAGQNSILEPFLTRIDKIRFNVIFLGGGYKFFLRVDKQRLPAQNKLNILFMRQDKPLLILVEKDIKKCSDFHVLKAITWNNLQKK
ncbi:MAG TPA: hypothetical protein VMX18_04360 [Candidatus Bipolaricaulota bacterium]|nr:hypothetical protein [Candidatus Bipolaricaulota bacterium]